MDKNVILDSKSIELLRKMQRSELSEALVYRGVAERLPPGRDKDVLLRLASLPPTALAAWLAWYDTTPDTPCIAICSTSQGDDWCKGCGRSFDEVQFWPAMGPAEKRAVWRRITLEHTAWRFNRYAERAAEGPSGAAPP